MKPNMRSTSGRLGILINLINLATMFSLFVCRATAQNLGAVCPGWSVTNDVRMALDLNRDGKADLAAFDDGYVSGPPSSPLVLDHSALWTAVNNGNGTFSVQKAVPNLDAANAGDPTKHIRMLVDLNGDHVPDIVIFGDAGVWTALSQQSPRAALARLAVENTGQQGNNNTFEPPVAFGTPQLVLQNFGGAQGWDPQKHVRLVLDLNHDGYPDILGFGEDGVWVAFGKGDGTFGPVQPAMANQNFGVQQGWSVAKDVRLLADLNNDGYPDIVGFGLQGVWTAMNNGNGTFADARLGLPNYFGSEQGWTPAKHMRLTAVLNNIGLADIIAFGDQGVWTALGNGDGTFQTPKLVMENFGVAQGWDPAKHIRLMADLNNDGRDDIVAFGDAGVWTALSVGHGTFAPSRLAVTGTGPQVHTPPVAEPGAGTFEPPRLVLENFGVKQEWSPAKHIRVMADLNGDHYPDIIGFGDGGVWAALGNGDGSFQKAQFTFDYFACNGKFDFNLEWTGTDPNGFPLNPQWRWQLYNPPPNTSVTAQSKTPDAETCHFFSAAPGGADISFVPSFSDCTDQTNQVNQPWGWNAVVCAAGTVFGFPGHVNWRTATFHGAFSFGDHNLGDDDYDNSLYVPGYPAMMNGRDSQHVEFDSDETIDYFNTPWWNEFHNAVSPGWGTGVIGTPAKGLLHDAEAIVTGMFGVDCEHDGCKSEIHPVFTLAAHVFDNPDNDTWAMFLRNTGDEGYCSSNVVQDNFTSYTFRLPWRTKEPTPWTSVEVLWGPDQSTCTQSQESQAESCFEQLDPPGGATGPTITYLVGQWVNVTFTFPAPTDTPLIDGELHLRWGRGPISNAPLAASSPGTTSPAPSSAPSSDQEKEPDESGPLGIALGKLSPAQQNQIRKTVAAATASGAKLKVMPAGNPALELKPSEVPAPHPVVRSGELGGVATQKAARDAALMRELCKAYGGSIDGAPANMCAQASH
jgi:FG-GAP-like repeat